MSNFFLKGFAVFVISVVFLVSVCHFIDQMYHADRKEFWVDEKFSLKMTVQANTYLGLLGKPYLKTETNQAPLDYLFTKMLDDIKPAVHSFGLSDKVYYRLWANFVMVLSGLVVVCLFVRDILRSPSSDLIRVFQLLLLMGLPFMYLYRPMTYHYAAEVRPYALWFAVWFITIGVCSLSRTSKFGLGLCLSLLAMTMVGSVFQILSVGIAYFTVRWLQSEWKEAIKDNLKVITIPLLLVVFYAFPADYGHHLDEPAAHAWHRFHELWGHNAIIIPMLFVAILLLFFSPRTRPMITGPLAVLIVFLMGPLIFNLTLGRGYFFTERQYIYYDAHRAVFWLSLINFLPFYLEKIKNQKRQVMVMAVFVAIWFPFVFTKKIFIYIHFALIHLKAIMFHS